MKESICNNTTKAIIILFFAFCMLYVCPLSAAEQGEEAKKQPVTKYWMSVSTINQTIPGMSEAMAEMGKMFGGRGGPGFGPHRELKLQLNSPQQPPADPQETHDIPLGQKMGKTLPLLIQEAERTRPVEREEMPAEQKFEKPKFRMLIYWGCGDTVRSGQPKVIDTEKMNPGEFGKTFSGVHPTPQYPPSPRSGWMYADWPNRKSALQVPADSSLQGDHFVHGNYAPEIRFSIGPKHDFMAPVDFTSVQGGLSDSIKFQWKSIPTAIGYFAMAIGYKQQNGEMIFWSSSEIPDTAYSLLDFLSPDDVQKFIKEKIVMPSPTTACNIPRGIFKDTEGSMLQFIAYGDELNVAYPPKPKDPNEPWNLIWTAKVRLKSTGMLFLGQMEDTGHSRSGEKMEERYQEKDSPSIQQEPGKKEEPYDSGTVKKLRGILGF